MLEVNQVSKRYPKSESYALRDVSFTLGRGEVVGLVGRNGAGKTTLLKMIAKSLRPTEGRITVDGTDLFSRDGMLDDFGIMIRPAFYPQLSAVENIRFYLDVHGRADCRRNIRPMLELVDLWGKRNLKPRTFSFGMRQRLALAISMVTEPDYLILDEPFVGLDPTGVRQLVDTLREWAKDRNTAILVSSHQLHELERMCGRYLFLEDGRLRDRLSGGAARDVDIDLASPVTDADALRNLFPEAVVAKDRRSVRIPGDYQRMNELMAYLPGRYGVIGMHDAASRLDECFERSR